MALALRHAQPELNVAIIERGPSLCGNHTWCFYEHDVAVAGDLQNVVGELTEQRWPAYDVMFSNHQRTLHSGYAMISSERLRNVLLESQCERLQLFTQTNVLNLTATSVTTSRGPDDSRAEISAKVVIDNRGASADYTGNCGYQKFVGLEVDCERPHGVPRPIVMDATVDQHHGYRFFYVLPLSATRLLIEDTYFSDGSELDVAEVRQEIADYARAKQWNNYQITRQETGILPLPWSADGPSLGDDDVIAGGYRGRWFHPATGYSFPLAWKLAVQLATTPLATWRDSVRRLADDCRRQQTFALRLNWMLFRWFRPEQRHNVLSRFYRLPEATIARFYALDSTALDRMRVLVGRPPKGMSWRGFWKGAA
jgi:lycopene beta-cyclase